MPQTASTTPSSITGLNDMPIEITSILNIPVEFVSPLFQHFIINEESMTDFDTREDVFEAKPLTMILHEDDDPDLIKEVLDVYYLCVKHHCKYFRVSYL